MGTIVVNLDNGTNFNFKNSDPEKFVKFFERSLRDKTMLYVDLDRGHRIHVNPEKISTVEVILD